MQGARARILSAKLGPPVAAHFSPEIVGEIKAKMPRGGKRPGAGRPRKDGAAKQSKPKPMKTHDKTPKLNQRQAGYLKGLAAGKSKLDAALAAGWQMSGVETEWYRTAPEEQREPVRWTAYDLTQAAEHIRNTMYPEAEEFAERYILNPPSEDEILAACSRVELQ